MVGSVLLTSLTSKELVHRLKSSGKVLRKVGKIFEKRELDGNDLSVLTHNELCVLLPKLRMWKKLEYFVSKLGFKLVMPKNDISNIKKLNPDLPALEPSTPSAFELISGSSTREEKRKVLEKKITKVPDLTKESSSDSKKWKVKEFTWSRAKRKGMPSVPDLKRLAKVYDVKFKQIRWTVEAAEKMRRSIFISGLPVCTTNKDHDELRNDLKRRIEQKTTVSGEKLQLQVKKNKSTGRVTVRSTDVHKLGSVLKALDGMVIKPGFKLFAMRDSIPKYSFPYSKALYEGIKPHLKKFYPNLVDSLEARRIQEAHTSGNQNSSCSGKSQIIPNGHNISSSSRSTGCSTAPSINQWAGPRVAQSNKSRSSTVIPHNEEGARPMGAWGVHQEYLRSTTQNVERMNMVPNLRDKVGYEIERIPSALRRRNQNENVPFGRIYRGVAPRGSMTAGQQGELEQNRGYKRRWNEVVENEPRGTHFIERRLNRGRN